MKVALVHDMLVEFGGGERVLQAFVSLFPTADVYVGFYDKKVVKEHFPSLSPDKIYSTLAQGTPLMSRSSLFQALSPLIWQSLNVSGYDLVISSSSYFLSLFVSVKHGRHVQYIHSPPKNIIGLIPQTPFQKLFPYETYLVPLYKKALKTKNAVVITNSFHMQKMIYQNFGVTPEVVYPPVSMPKRVTRSKKQSYYLMVGRIDTEKNIELAIEACNALRAPLKIVGITNDVPYEKYLKRIAGPTIEFLGFRSDAEVETLYRKAIAFLFTAKNEDFGIAPLEAIAHGVPVVAYWGGGVKETIQEGETGLFFRDFTSRSLVQAMIQCKKRVFNEVTMKKHMRKYSIQVFNEQIRSFL